MYMSTLLLSSAPAVRVPFRTHVPALFHTRIPALSGGMAAAVRVWAFHSHSLYLCRIHSRCGRRTIKTTE